MSENIFVKGINFFKRKDTQPDFVLGTMVVNVDDLINFLKTTAKEYETVYTDKNGTNHVQVKFQILRQKDDRDKLNFMLDTYKPTRSETLNNAAKQDNPVMQGGKDGATVVDESDDLLF